MNLGDYNRVYFIGIGGIGMSALARWFKQNGYEVAGYDRTDSPLTRELTAEGIAIHYEDEIVKAPEEFRGDFDRLLVVYTPAVPAGMTELRYFQERECAVYKRSQVLGFITASLYTVAVAGTHGKTTTSSMIAHLLKYAGKDIVAFLGGITVNYGTNFIVNEDDPLKAIAVVEADEYDRSFLTLHPNVAVVTSVDPDHLDIYGDEHTMLHSFREFIQKVNARGKLFVQEGIAEELIPDDFGRETATYGLNHGQSFADNVSIENGYFIFDYTNEDFRLSRVRLGVAGFHNVENAVAAIAVALHLGIGEDVIKAGIESYRGVRRRFEFILRDDKVLIDDYAHHPTEIAAFLHSLKALYPHRQVTVIFQPHLYSRTRDFADGFAASLAIADQVILLPIYPAREEPIPGVDSAMLLNMIDREKKYLVEKNELHMLIDRLETDIIATVGAGDIDRLVLPLKQHLEAL